jgi:hypothetical protein
MRHIALWIVTLVVCLGLGFSFGAYPQFWDKIFGRTEQKTVVMIVSDQQSLPEGLAQKFSDETGYTLQIQEIKTPNLFLADAKSANLLYAPWEWLEPSKASLHTWTDQLWSQLFADFQSADIFAQKFFPLFWKLKTDPHKQFYFEGLATFKEPTDGTKYFLRFLMDHEELMKDWTRKKNMGSTLQKASRWTDFPETLKPQAMRASPLAELTPPSSLKSPMVKPDSKLKPSSEK